MSFLGRSADADTLAGWPTQRELRRHEAGRLKLDRYGDPQLWELPESGVRRNGVRSVTLFHRLRDPWSGASAETIPDTNYD